MNCFASCSGRRHAAGDEIGNALIEKRVELVVGIGADATGVREWQSEESARPASVVGA